MESQPFGSITSQCPGFPDCPEKISDTGGHRRPAALASRESSSAGRSPHPRLDTPLRHEAAARARIALEAAALIHLRITSLGKAAATVVFLDCPDATAPAAATTDSHGPALPGASQLSLRTECAYPLSPHKPSIQARWPGVIQAPFTICYSLFPPPFLPGAIPRPVQPHPPVPRSHTPLNVRRRALLRNII
jgi:hypothetical protein